LTARLSLSRQQNHNPQGRVPCSLASSLRMAVPLLTTTSRRRAPFSWCCISRKACRSLSRPSLARCTVFGQVAAFLTCFPLEKPAYALRDKSPPHMTSLLLTDKRRIHLRSTSVRTYTFFTTGFPRFLSIRGARGLQAFDLPLLTNYSNPNYD
jgi:hypothetical protein